MRQVRALMREAIASARSSRVASIVTIVMIAGMCAAVLLTTGRTVGAEQAVISSIDSAGTRSIVIRAEADAGLQADVLNRIANLDGIAWAGAFGPAVDATNALNVDGVRVPSDPIRGLVHHQLVLAREQPCAAEPGDSGTDDCDPHAVSVPTSR